MPSRFSSLLFVIALFVFTVNALDVVPVQRSKPAASSFQVQASFDFLRGSADASQVTVSGLSAGAFFASQFHVIYSSLVKGAAIVAGGPYWSALGNAATALSIMTNPQLINIPLLQSGTESAATLGSIDSPAHLAKTKVFIFSGLLDTVVHPGIAWVGRDYYLKYMPESSIKVVKNVPAEHAMITDNYGNACDYLGPKYINNCNMSLAGDILTYMYGPMQPRKPMDPRSFFEINQASFIPPPFTPWQVGLDSRAYAYVPVACQNQTSSHRCPLHLAFHGCQQSISMAGEAFSRYSGYNEWAEANSIIILYPNAQPNTLNPKGCFDWWGYSGTTYATRLGYQPATVKNMIDFFTK